MINTSKRKWLYFSGLLITIITIILFMSSTNRLKVGDKAPEFSLPDAEGNMVSLSDFKNSKNVVLFFYPKDETPGCTAEACRFRDEYDAFLDLHAEVIGISSDSEDSHKKFSANHSLSYPLLSDRGGKVRKAYGVPNTFFLIPGRVTFVIDKEGIIRHIFNSQFNSERHIDEALEVLKKM